MIGLKHGDLKRIAQQLGVSHEVVRTEAVLMNAGKKGQSKRIRKAIRERQEENIAEFIQKRNLKK